MAKLIEITPLKRFINLLTVDKQEIISIYIYAIFNGVLTLSLPLGIQAIINLIGGGQVSTSWILLVVFVILGVAFSGIMQIMQLTISENVQQKIFTRSAFEFAYRIPRMKMESLEGTHTPELINRFFDTVTVQKGLSKILMDFSTATLQVIFGLILLSLYHPFFILFSFLLVVIVYFIFRFTAAKGLKSSIKESKNKYEVLHWLEELARTMETFKLSGGSPLPLTKTNEAVSNYLKSRKTHFKVLLLQYINLVAFKVIVAAGLLIIGGLLVIEQRMNIGQFVASEIIIILVLSSVEKLILSMETIYDVLTAIEKIGNVTDIPLDEEDGIRETPSENEGLSLQLSEVSYAFSDSKTEALSDINLDIKSGEKICLSGLNGAGKSLLMYVVSGLYSDYSGIININGTPLGSWQKEYLHSIIGLGLSKEDIFNGTLLENITLCSEGTSLVQVHEILEVVGLQQYVSTFKKGVHTKLQPEGKNIPKGIRSKIILARIIYGKPKLIIIDNVFHQFNELDKNRILDYLLGMKCTIIAISNRSAIANRFDRTLVMDKGEVLAFEPLDKLKKENWFTTLFDTE